MKRIIAIALVTAAFTTSPGCDNAGQRLEKYLAQGDSYLEQKNFDKARVSYKNALQIDPENLAAKLKFADLLERVDDYKGAYGLYLSVLEKDPQNVVALEHQGKILMMARESDQAMENAEKLLKIKGADFVPGLTLKAGVLSSLGKSGEALELAERAEKLDPTYLETSILLGALYMRQADFAHAETTFRTAIKAHPDVNGLKIMLAESLKKQGRNDDVEVVLRSLTQSEPNVLAHAMELSRHLNNNGKSADALKVMNEYVQSHGKDFDAKIAYIQLIDVASGTEQGDAALAQFIKAEPSAYRLQFAQIERQLAQNKRDDAVKGLEAIIGQEKTSNDAMTARVMLARLRVGEKDVSGAKKLLDEVLALNSGDLGALALRGRIAIGEKRFGDGISDLRAVVKERTDDLDSLMLLASAHVANDEIDLADELLFKAVKLNPTNRKLHLMLAEVKARKGENDTAIAEYRAVLEKTPDDETSLMALAKLYQSKNDVPGLSEIADRLLAGKNTMAAGFFYQGLVKQVGGAYEEARELFEKALTLSEDAVEPTTAMVKSFVQQKQSAQAIAWLDQRLSKKPANATLLNLKAEVQMADQQYDAAAISLRKAIDANPAWWVPYRSLSSVQVMKKDFDGAQKTLEKGVAATGKNPLLRMELAAFFDRSGKVDESIAVYRQMVDDGMSGDSVINNLAMLLVTKTDAKSLEDARVFSERLAQTTNPLYLDTAGWVNYKRGDYQAALPILERAVDLAPKHPQIRYHLGVAYYRSNQPDKAKENLALALKETANFDGRKEAEQVWQELSKVANKAG